MAGLAKSLGNGSMSNDFREFGSKTGCFFIIGSNTSHNHPIIAMHVQRALDRGAKLIVVDPKRTEMAQKADVFLQIPPGYNIPTINCIINVLIRENLYNKKFVEECTNGFEYLKMAVEPYTPEAVGELTGVDPELFVKAARIYAENSPSAILYAMGLTQFSHGTGNVWSVSNLAAITGNLGIEGAGVNPLRGQNNVQGACMLGALPTVLPSGKPVINREGREELENIWNCKLPEKPGFVLTEAPEKMDEGKIKFLYVMGENPVVSDPWTDHFLHSIENLDFMLVQDIFLTQTASYADVVLPAACFAEKSGTFVNTSRRVQLVNKAVDPPGYAMTDMDIICQMAKNNGKEGYNYNSAEDVWDEIRTVSRNQFGGMSFRRLKDANGISAPCPNHHHDGTPCLYEGSVFSTPDKKAVLVPVVFTPEFAEKENFGKSWKEKLNLPEDYPFMAGSVIEKISEKYPFILTTGRYVYHYHTGTMTRPCAPLMHGADQYHHALEIGKETALNQGLREGDYVRIENERGMIAAPVRIMERIAKNTIFGTFHYWEANVNELTIADNLDPVSKIPELKVTAVKLTKITESEYISILRDKKFKYFSDGKGRRRVKAHASAGGNHHD